MIGRRDHGVEEIRSKLVGKGFSTTAIDAAIADCIRLGYLDDERFAAGVVLAGQRHGYGPRRITQKLLAKGIGGDLAMRILTENYDEDRQIAICREVLARKPGNIIIILWALPKIQPEFIQREYKPSNWIKVLLIVVAMLAVLAFIAINSHGEMPGMHLRFE